MFKLYAFEDGGWFADTRGSWGRVARRMAELEAEGVRCRVR